METVSYLVLHYGYLAIFALLMLGIFGIPIPDELLLTFAGYLVFRGELQLVPTMLVVVSGSIFGISLNYVVGRAIGANLIFKYLAKFNRLSKLQNFSKRLDGRVVFWGYFLPGVRHWVTVAAGIAKLPLAIFALFAYSGGFIWSVLFISLGYFLGREGALLSQKICLHLQITVGVIVSLLSGYFLVREKWRRHRCS